MQPGRARDAGSRDRVVIDPCPSKSVARNRLGSVVMSPSAVTIGVETESRSQPSRVDAADKRDRDHQDQRRAERAADHRDVNRSQIEIDGCPTIAAATPARAPRATATTRTS